MSEDRPHCIKCQATTREAALRPLRTGRHVCFNGKACGDRARNNRLERERKGAANEHN